MYGQVRALLRSQSRRRDCGEPGVHALEHGKHEQHSADRFRRDTLHVDLGGASELGDAPHRKIALPLRVSVHQSVGDGRSANLQQLAAL
jgi:hypothetical protein